SSASELIDRAPDEKTLGRIESAVSQTDGVRSYHAFRARNVGGKIAADIHIQVDPDLTVQTGHDIATEVRRKVMEANPHVIEVIVHVEPAEDS
ncbi:MAG: cation-efflux pump, partial [Phycisphaerae bacterium]|nr:cation-efflux pump [Phycisphaerae bacterium]